MVSQRPKTNHIVFIRRVLREARNLRSRFWRFVILRYARNGFAATVCIDVLSLFVHFSNAMKHFSVLHSGNVQIHVCKMYTWSSCNLHPYTFQMRWSIFVSCLNEIKGNVCLQECKMYKWSSWQRIRALDIWFLKLLKTDSVLLHNLLKLDRFPGEMALVHFWRQDSPSGTNIIVPNVLEHGAPSQ